MPTLEETLLANERRRAQRARAEEALRLAQAHGHPLSLRDIQTPGGPASVLINPAGAIAAPVTNSRPLTPEEYRALDSARGTPEYAATLRDVYAPERRAQAHTYAPDALLSRAERDRLAQRALEEDAARNPNRQIQIAQNRQALREWAWANANTPLTDTQRAAHERWLRRTEDRMTSGRNWNRDTIADRRYEQRRIDDIARAALDRQALTERQRLISQATVDAAQAAGQSELQKAILETQGKQYVADRNLEGTQATAQANRYAADQDLAAARLGAQADRDVAQTTADATRYAAEQRQAGQVTAAQLAAQADTYAADQTLAGANAAAQARVQAAQEAARGNVQAAEAQAQGNIGAATVRAALGDGPDTAYDRAQKMINLGIRLMNGGYEENELIYIDRAIDLMDLAPEEKARRKELVRANTREAGLWFMGQGGTLFAQAGYPGMPLPGGGAIPDAPNPAIHDSPAGQSPASSDVMIQSWN